MEKLVSELDFLASCPSLGLDDICCSLLFTIPFLGSPRGGVKHSPNEWERALC